MTAPVRFTSVPPLTGTVYPGGYDGRYRLWTVAHGLDFDAVPAHADGGPATVTVSEWSFSTTNVCRVLSSPSVVEADNGLHTIGCTRGVTLAETEKHVLHGQQFPTRRDASRAAYNAGVLGFMVYERHAEQYGLLIAT